MDMMIQFLSYFRLVIADVGIPRFALLSEEALAELSRLELNLWKCNQPQLLAER